MQTRTWLLSDDQTDVSNASITTTGAATCVGMSQELADEIAEREAKREPFGFAAALVEPEKPKRRKKATR